MLLGQVAPTLQKTGPVEKAWHVNGLTRGTCGEGSKSRGTRTETGSRLINNLTCPKEAGERGIQVTDVVRVAQVNRSRPQLRFAVEARLQELLLCGLVAWRRLLASRWSAWANGWRRSRSLANLVRMSWVALQSVRSSIVEKS